MTRSSARSRRVGAFVGAGALAALTSVAGCEGESADDTASTTSTPAAPATTSVPDGPAEVELRYDFGAGSDGWAAELSDFSDATRPDDVIAQTGEPPPGIDAETGFFRLAASNRSDDLFHYMMRRIGADDGLEPSTTYSIDFNVTFASNAPSDCVGIGGAPGESVWLKVGATDAQPVPVEDDGDTRLDVDKGNQSQGGDTIEVAGVIANGIPCEEALGADRPYALVTLEETVPGVATGDDGELWLVVGTESGFEGRTDLYYDTVEIILTPTG